MAMAGNMKKSLIDHHSDQSESGSVSPLPKRASKPPPSLVSLLIPLFGLFFISFLFRYFSPFPLSIILPFIPPFYLFYSIWKKYYLNDHGRTKIGLIRVWGWMLFVFIWAFMILSAPLHLYDYFHSSYATSTTSFPFIKSILFDILYCAIFPFLALLALYQDSNHSVPVGSLQSHLFHFFADRPGLIYIRIFKFFKWPLNRLATEIQFQLNQKINNEKEESNKKMKENGHDNNGKTLSIDIESRKLYLGAAPLLDSEFLELKQKYSIGYAVNLCAELPSINRKYKKFGIEVLYLPTVDGSEPLADEMEKAVEWIHSKIINQSIPMQINQVIRNDHSRPDNLRMKNDSNSNRLSNVFIHCKCGMGRSASIVLAYMASYGGISLSDAAMIVKGLRPEVAMSVIQYESLQKFLETFREKNHKIKMNE